MLLVILNQAYLLWDFSCFCKADAVDKVDGKAGTCFNFFLFRVLFFYFYPLTTSLG